MFRCVLLVKKNGTETPVSHLSMNCHEIAISR
jgi:hypothetical protein